MDPHVGNLTKHADGGRFIARRWALGAEQMRVPQVEAMEKLDSLVQSSAAGGTVVDLRGPRKQVESEFM